MPRSAAPAASAAATSASAPIHASVAAVRPPPKNTAQNEAAAAADAGPRAGPGPPARSPAARTGGDASIVKTTRLSRSQTVYMGITARTPRTKRLESARRTATRFGADRSACGDRMTTKARTSYEWTKLLVAASLGALALL